MAEQTTILTFSAIGIPPYSARGLTQTLEPIGQAAKLRRTINAVLKDISGSAFQKYRSSIRGEDIDPPEIDEVWPGLQCTVGCIVEIGYSATAPARTAVAGSEREDDDGFKFYRPQLIMRVIGFTVQRDEYGAVHTWQMDLEEI